MGVPQEQIEELKSIFPGVLRCDEGGLSFFLIPSLELPEGADPARTDVLLCPMQRDGYESRLFFAEKTRSAKRNVNWNSTFRILERNWHAFSWRTKPNLRLAQMVAEHLRAFRQ
jgi:hypothetical protein